jgi:hypothetical protein
MSVSSPIASHSFAFQPFTACCTAPISHSMTAETAHDLPISHMPISDDAQSDSGAESTAPITSSSPTLATTKMEDRKVPKMSDFFQKATVTEEERVAYHSSVG